MTHLHDGNFLVEIRDGALGSVICGGVEILRALTYPVRNADWGTHVTVTENEEATATHYVRRFVDAAGAFTGEFRVEVSGTSLTAEVALTFTRPCQVNRAGFTLLHPIRDVAGSPLTIRHSNGRNTKTAFPALVSPGQPARDIVGLSHRIGPVQVDIAMGGEVFEMEDQRNWSDASFKTYCRPLELPRPFPVVAGETMKQRIVFGAETVSHVHVQSVVSAPAKARMPQVMLAHETGLSNLATLHDFPGVSVLARLSAHTADAELLQLARRPGTAIEIVFDDLASLDAMIARIRTAGVSPVRVVALPRPYLQSHQPEGPWPEGPAPGDALARLRAGFPAAAIGGGSLTNFTELNRCRPDPALVDFVTFGNTAIVHAADDLSVWQTLEALPDIFATATRIAAGKPLHLGLLSIGMRSNPYGAAVTPNPLHDRIPMAMDDPRQGTGFAAAYAVAVLARAATAGVQSLSLAMPAGPLGAQGLLAEVIRATARLAGRVVTIHEQGGIVVIDAGDRLIAANCTSVDARAPIPGLRAIEPGSVILESPQRTHDD